MKNVREMISKFQDYFVVKKRKNLENKERAKYHKHVLKQEKIRNQNYKECKSDKYLVLEKLSKIYDNHIQAVYDCDLEVEQGEFVVFVGPSGCGKSTTLRMIAGLEEITSGDLFIDGEYSNFALPKERGIAMVFQSYALYPHMSVYKNIGFSLKFAKIPYETTDSKGNTIIKYRKYRKDEINEKVHEVAELLELTDYLDRKPKALSGGQCQRVALGRAIIRNPKLFLMDEPLSNLDAKLRASMRSEIVALHKRIKATTIYVTHDQTEAMTMADRIVIMKDGYVQQIDKPLEIYNHPANIFVATFVGTPAMNLIKTKISGESISFGDKTFKIDNISTETIKNFYLKEIALLNQQLKEYDERFNERNALLEKIQTLTQDIERNKEEIKALNTKLEAVEAKAIYRTKIIQNIANIEKLINENSDEFEVVLGIRPEDILVEENGEHTSEINAIELLGHDYLIKFNYFNTDLTAKALIKNKDLPQSGSTFRFSLNTDKVHVFDPITTKNII